MIKVALIGIGGMGFVHYNAYKDIENAEVIAVADVRCDMAKEKIGEDKVNVYETMQELLEHETPDMIDICTPSYLHKEIAVEALEKGYHVLCEKPMALKASDAEEMIEAAKKSGKLFMTAHVVRFMNPYKYLKSVIDSGELGKVVRIVMQRLSAIPRWTWEDWMRDLEKSGGTPMDLSIHDLDFTQYVFGMPKDIKSVYHKRSDNNDYVSTELVYDDFSVCCEGAWYNCDFPFRAEYRAVFQDGVVELRDWKVTKNGEEVDLNTAAASGDTGLNITTVDGYGEEIQYFVDCVEKGVKPEIVTPESSKRSVEIAERIAKSGC